MTAQERAKRMFPCNCNPFQDSSHWHNCQSQYTDMVAEAIEAAARDSWNNALEQAAQVAQEEIISDRESENLAAAIRALKK